MFADTPGTRTFPSLLNTRRLPSGDQSCLAATLNSRSDLDHIAAIEVRSKQGGSDRLSVLGDKAEFLAAGRNVRIGTTRANDSLPVVPVEIHGPERFIVRCRIKAVEDNA